MEISQILTADFLDIIFEGKNKSYGAYELRKTYSRRLALAIAVMCGVVTLLTILFLFNNDGNNISTQTWAISDTVHLVSVDPPEQEILLPPPAQKQPQPVMEKAFVNITIVHDNLVPPDQDIPENKDLENARINLVNQQGALFDDVIAPPIQEAASRGIVAHPKRSNPDSVFLKTEIESQYPGGQPAWQRFLIKNLSNNYPQDAADQGIQGKVIVQFIVDKQGSVSDVRAVSGPAALHETAVKVIKKSGKWVPASQNGQTVNSYKSQPIHFALGDQ